MTNIPSYHKALHITETHEAFYVQRGEVVGYEYAMFNYRLASCEDFRKADALELRGLTFLKTDEGWVKYPMLTKFFNMNQCDCTQYHEVSDKEIDSIEYKEDGSLISLVVLPNGKIVPKTKMSFDNDQTTLATKWLEKNPEVTKVVGSLPTHTFLFELVSPKNKIVLKYRDTELKLLQVREPDGSYMTTNDIIRFSETMGIASAKVFKNSLNELIEMRETLEDIEGWIIKFTDGQFIKLKTEWYITAHGLMEDLHRENKIIEMIMGETIDDLLGELGDEERDELNVIIENVDKYYNYRVQKALDMRKLYFEEFNENRKDFAINFSKVVDFGIVMRNLKGNGIPEAIKDQITRENSSLEKARDFIERLRVDN